jgi:hypothetical protein
MTTTLPTTRTYTQRGSAVVSRNALDSGTATMWFEITVLRTWRQKHPTYQGTVVLRDGTWHAETPTRDLLGTFADYADAENALLHLRTGVVSTQPWTGPRPYRCGECDDVFIGRSEHDCPHPKCSTCGWHLYDGKCRRTDLHWTPASIAADEARRAERRNARTTA